MANVVMNTKRRKTPRSLGNCAGLRFLPNRRDSDYLGQVETSVLLNVLVVDIISDDSGNHTDDKRHHGRCHFEHLLSS